MTAFLATIIFGAIGVLLGIAIVNALQGILPEDWTR